MASDKKKLKKGARKALAKHLKAPKTYKRSVLVKDMKKLEKFYKDAAAKPAKALARKSAKKGIARKVLGKLGLPGKIAVGASIAYDVARSIPRGKKKPLAKGKKCKTGESVVRVGGKTYCMGKPRKK